MSDKQLTTIDLFDFWKFLSPIENATGKYFDYINFPYGMYGADYPITHIIDDRQFTDYQYKDGNIEKVIYPDMR